MPGLISKKSSNRNAKGHYQGKKTRMICIYIYIDVCYQINFLQNSLSFAKFTRIRMWFRELNGKYLGTLTPGKSHFSCIKGCLWNQFRNPFRLWSIASEASRPFFTRTSPRPNWLLKWLSSCLSHPKASLSLSKCSHCERHCAVISSFQTRCIVKGEAQKSPPSGDFLKVSIFSA